MSENKHYIRINEDNEVIKGFSDAFEDPLVTDICINEDAGRHFKLKGKVNPPLTGDSGQPLYYYKASTDKVKKTTEAMQNTWINAHKPVDPRKAIKRQIKAATNIAQIKRAMIAALYLEDVEDDPEE